MPCTKLAGGALGPPDKGRSSWAEGVEGRLDLDIAGAWEIFNWCGLGLWRRERPATESGSTWQERAQEDKPATTAEKKPPER